MAVKRSLRLLLPALLLVPATALAGPAPASAPSKPAPRPSAGAHLLHRTAHMEPAKKAPPVDPGKSIGSPTEGHLLGGAHLTESPYLRIVPVYQGGDARWGLGSLVGLIDRSARAVRSQFPDAVLSVGHLSKPGGGEIDRHASHESGRDADIGFYIKNQQNKPIYEDHFVAFLGDGTAPTWPGARFDDARNWALVSSLVGDGHAHITHIFVATPIRARLLEYAAKIGAPQNIRVRAAELMAQPKGSLPHDDHFHVRIGCPAGMEQCIEQPQPKHHHHGALASAKHAPPPHHASAPAAPSAGPAKPHAPADKREDAKKEEEAKSDSTPTLGPIVPGLDSAVIPAPLAMPKGEEKPAEKAAEPKAPPIDDPDGVLEEKR